jgi:hypothetical protein
MFVDMSKENSAIWQVLEPIMEQVRAHLATDATPNTVWPHGMQTPCSICTNHLLADGDLDLQQHLVTLLVDAFEGVVKQLRPRMPDPHIDLEDLPPDSRSEADPYITFGLDEADGLSNPLKILNESTSCYAQFR